MMVLTSVLTVVALPFLVVAHGVDNLQARHHYARQTTSSASSHPGSTSISSAASGTVSSASVSGSVGANSSSTQNFTISLLSTNPTAVPLASIVSNEPSLPTQALTTTEVPGATPSDIPNAPPLPNSTFCPLLRPAASISLLFLIVANLNAAANYPPLDKTPPIDSPEVQQWIQDVLNTGIVIPNLTVTNPGSCCVIFRLTAVDNRSRWMWQ